MNIPEHSHVMLKSCLLLLSVAALVGCSKQSKLPPLAPASGIVTVDGEPLEMGSIAFVPDKIQGTKGPMGYGTIGKGGRYYITTAKEEGALVGHHLVRIVADVEYDPVTNTPPRTLVHPRYTKETTSELEVEVKAGEENEFDFALDGPGE